MMKQLLIFVGRPVKWVGCKLESTMPTLASIGKITLSILIGIYLVKIVPLLAIGLAVTPFVRQFKNDYAKVITAFVGGLVAYGLMGSGLFFVGDILILFTAVAISDMIQDWQRRVEAEITAKA